MTKNKIVGPDHGSHTKYVERSAFQLGGPQPEAKISSKYVGYLTLQEAPGAHITHANFGKRALFLLGVVEQCRTSPLIGSY